MEAATRMFRSTMTVLSSEVACVMLEATTTASKLDSLEEKLYVLRTLCEEELIITNAAIGDLLSELWTVLGGNRAKRQGLEHQVDILQNVDWYRSVSMAHVVATTHTLLAMEAELGQLRDKLTAPEVPEDVIPLEVHIASIQRSANRINEGKLKIRGESVRIANNPTRVNLQHTV